MIREKVSLECIGGPADGRTVQISSAARFVDLPYVLNVPHFDQKAERWLAFGKHRYERDGGLAFYRESLL